MPERRPFKELGGANHGWLRAGVRQLCPWNQRLGCHFFEQSHAGQVPYFQGSESKIEAADLGQGPGLSPAVAAVIDTLAGAVLRDLTSQRTQPG